MDSVTALQRTHGVKGPFRLRTATLDDAKGITETVYEKELRPGQELRALSVEQLEQQPPAVSGLGVPNGRCSQ